MISLATEGKIVKAVSGFYYVLAEDVIYQCRARGVFRKQKITPLVGDVVKFEAENLTDGYVVDVLPRKNELVRPPIANVDQALIVFSVKEPELSLQLLDKFLVHIEANHIEAVICFTKMDLLSEEERKQLEKIVSVYHSIGYEVIYLSAVNEEGIEQMTSYFKDKITVIAGQSGVGKSSLLNRIDPTLNIETKKVSKQLGRGRHTTRHVELLHVAGGLVADTPGFSSLDLNQFNAEDLSQYFPEMNALRSQCKFRVCTHRSEPNCAIKQALEEGKIAKTRYEHYQAFYAEIQETKRRY